MPALNVDLCRVAEPPIVAAQSWALCYIGQHGPALDLCQAVPGYAPHPEMLRHLAFSAADPALTNMAPLMASWPCARRMRQRPACYPSRW